MDKINRPLSISVPTTYAQPMASPQADECKPSATSAQRPTISAWKTPFELQHLEVTTTAPARKTAIVHRDCLVNFSQANLHDQRKHCFMEFDTSLFLILQCAIGLFNYRTTAMYRERRISLRATKGNVPTKGSPIMIQLQDYNGLGKNKADVHIASRNFPFSVSKLSSSIFSLDR